MPRVVSPAHVATYPTTDSAPPPKDSLFWTLWHSKEVQVLAQKALATSYIQGIKAGTLNPDRYGAYNIADAYYCYKGADDYQVAAARAEDRHLKAYLEAKYRSYESYNAYFLKHWYVKDAAAVTPPQAMRDYAELESNVVRNESPIYALIAMIPCEYLWPWLANQITDGDVPGNVYRGWISDNNSFHGAYKIGNFLHAFMVANPGAVDPNKAQNIYSSGVSFEYLNFANAGLNFGDPDYVVER